MKTITWIPALLLAAGLAIGTAWAGESPRQMLEETARGMLRQLEAGQPGLADRPTLHALIEQRLVPLIDFGITARHVLGRHWRTATPDQRTAFAGEFKRLLIRSYAAALADYQGQEMRFVSERVDGRRAEVGSRLHQSGKLALNIDYRLYLTERGWRVYDLSVEGISLVMTYRNSFAEQIDRDGLDGLIRTLQDHRPRATASYPQDATRDSVDIVVM